MLKTTTWKPDTCGCELHYQWDTDASQDSRSHTPVESFVDASGEVKVTKYCPEHSDHTVHSLHAQVVEENQSKNYAREHVLKTLSHITKPILDSEGNQTGLDFKSGHEFKYSFDKNRKLHIEVTGLTDPDKATLDTTIKTKFGNNKINLI